MAMTMIFSKGGLDYITSKHAAVYYIKTCLFNHRCDDDDADDR